MSPKLEAIKKERERVELEIQKRKANTQCFELAKTVNKQGLTEEEKNAIISRIVETLKEGKALTKKGCIN